MITPFGRDIAALSYSWMLHLTIENKLQTDETSMTKIIINTHDNDYFYHAVTSDNKNLIINR